MKKTIILSSFLFVLISFNMGQEVEKTSETKYRRSSLHTMIIESDRFPMKDTIVKAFFDAPFPEKYDEHNFGEKSINPNVYTLTEEEKVGLKKSTSAAGDLIGSIGSGALTTFAASQGIALDPATFEIDRTLLPEEVPVIIMKYLKQNQIANKMVAKWYNRQLDGSFDMNLIFERGLYNASEKEASIAKKANDGINLLKSAGVELLGNTFVVVNKFKFIKNEIPANLARLGARMIASKLSSPFNEVAIKAADLAYEAASVGYSVQATSYLYKLKWNDSIQAVFENNLYYDKTTIDPTKKNAFEQTDLFQLEFVGSEKASGLVMLDLKSKGRSEETIIKTATIRTIDAVYLKLQKSYDVFMPKTALFSGDPLTAKIGMKEGLKGGEKFEVFESIQNPETGEIKYVSKGKITVDKKLLWDNRYNAGEDLATEITSEEASKEENLEKVPLDRTTFKGGKKFYAGMLIKQIK